MRVLGLVLVLALARTASADPINLSFEDGLVGWTATIPNGLTDLITPPIQPVGSITSANSFAGVYSAVVPDDGSEMALISSSNHHFVVMNPNPIWDITLSKTFTLNATDVLTGESFFYNGDPYGDQDVASVRILNSAGVEIARPWQESSGSLLMHGAQLPSVTEGYATPWTAWQFIAPTIDTYTLVLDMTTHPDNTLRSTAGFDHIQAVPEPASVVLLFTALSGGLVTRYRRGRAR